MKILSLHCDYLKFKAKKKALKSAEELESKEPVEVDNPLGIFVAVEKSDEGDADKAAGDLVENVLDLKKKTGAEKVVLYPYAHLSSSLSSPDVALLVLVEAETRLKKEGVEVFRAPFGYYKEFELKCKGHPLAELSREIGEKKIEISKVEKTNKVVKEEKVDHKKLLRQISKAKLDTSKLKDNDHRILGQKMDLFSFHDVAPGMVFWHDKGYTIYKGLIEFWRDEHKKAGYEEISTPQIMDKKLWQISGHWDKFSENNFLTDYEGRPFLIKPMNCPGGMLVYKSGQKSYKDLPLRVGEIGTVHRTELSGVLSGLFRVIKITQDDAHIFCTEEQLESEIDKIIELINKFYDRFGLEFDHVELSTRPEKRIGDEKLWDLAEEKLENVLKKKKMKYEINEGDGAFYGPKIDFHVKDSLDRTWQLSTIQLDMALPERFELEYTGKDGEKKRPIMLHRVIYGSIERFLGILLENKNGNLPVWLSPIQARVLSFTDRNIEKAREVLEKLKAVGVRADGDFESSTMSDKVRNAAMQKIPFILTMGDEEEKSGEVAIKERGKKELRKEKVEDFVEDIVEKIKNRD